MYVQDNGHNKSSNEIKFRGMCGIAVQEHGCCHAGAPAADPAGGAGGEGLRVLLPAPHHGFPAAPIGGLLQAEEHRDRLPVPYVRYGHS